MVVHSAPLDSHFVMSLYTVTAGLLPSPLCPEKAGLHGDRVAKDE